jgi:hypothetical protein
MRLKAAGFAMNICGAFSHATSLQCVIPSKALSLGGGILSFLIRPSHMRLQTRERIKLMAKQHKAPVKFWRVIVRRPDGDTLEVGDLSSFAAKRHVELMEAKYPSAIITKMED